MTNLTDSKVLSGIEFNKKYPSTKFVKLTNESENHNGFQFKTGLNIDTVPFNYTKDCTPGGIYFCSVDEIAWWVNYGNKEMKYYRIVTIPSDARVYDEDVTKMKADKLILSERKEISELPELLNEEFVKTAVLKNIPIVKHIQNATMYKIAIEQNACAFEYVKPELQTPELCEIAVRQGGLALKYVKPELQTSELCEIAVSQTGWALEFVKPELLTSELFKIASPKTYYLLEYIKLSI